MRLTLNCLLRCCHELFTHKITPEEFHLAVTLILSTLTPHTGTSHTLSQAVEFGEEMRLRLAGLPREQRRMRLAEIFSSSSTEDEVFHQAECELCYGGERERESQADASPETHTVCEALDSIAKPASSSSDSTPQVQEGRGSQITSTPAREPPSTGLQKKKLVHRSTSDNELVMRGVSGVPESHCPRPIRQLQAWRKRLGLREGSVFTGSLPDLELASEEEDSGDEEYVDPREIAGAVIPRKLSHRMSQRLMKRMDTITHTYLKIISPNDQVCDSGKTPPTIPVQRPHRERGRHAGLSDDSVNWDGDHDLYATIPALQPSQGHRERRMALNKKLSVSLDERIYERVDDILPNFGVKGIPRKFRLSRRSKVNISHRNKFLQMNRLDGYEYLESPVGDAPPIPPGLKRKPTLPPPRKSSAPALRTLGTQDHFDVQSSLSIPVSVRGEREEEIAVSLNFRSK